MSKKNKINTSRLTNESILNATGQEVNKQKIEIHETDNKPFNQPKNTTEKKMGAFDFKKLNRQQRPKNIA